MKLDTEQARENLLNFKMHQIPVKYVYGDDLDPLFDALESLQKSERRTIGLTLIRLDGCKNLLVCLTTDCAIHVLDLRQPAQTQFLNNLLTSDVGFKIYTVRGLVASHRFHSEFDIDINTEFVYDLTALDALISMRESLINGRIAAGQYTLSRFAEHSDLVRYRNRHDLMRRYMNLELEKKDKREEKEERKLVLENPESCEAKKVIRRRACLLDQLATSMEARHQEIFFQESTNLYNFACAVEGENYTHYANQDNDSYGLVIEYLKRFGSVDN